METDTITTITDLALGLDTVWMLLAAMLVFWMQPGFALVEAGFTRTKNTANILMKNLLDFSLGSLLFWALGFGIMWGAGSLWVCRTYSKLILLIQNCPSKAF